jgi:hypothetical protein
MNHDDMKLLREQINAGYINNKEALLSNLDRVFSETENDSPELRGLFAMHDFKQTKENKQKSLLTMYNELYEKVELDEDFDKDYEKWAEEEVFMFECY